LQLRFLAGTLVKIETGLVKTFIIAVFILLINDSDLFGQQLLDSLVHQNTVYGVDLALDNSKIFTAGKDSIGRVWNLMEIITGTKRT